MVKKFKRSFIILLMIAKAFSLPVLNDSIVKSDDEFIEELNENDIDRQEIEAPLDEDDLIDLTDLNLKIFGKPDNITTKTRLDNFDPNGSLNPEELGTYLEGDMLIPPSPSRNGMLSGIYRWPKGVIPYEIRGSFSPKELATIQQGINEYHTKTCIRFKPRTNEKDYISIVNQQTGCWSSIGRIGGRQEINLHTPVCLLRGSGTFVHEIMHAVGFLHEQNRHERDNYITVQFQNIKKDALHNFDKASSLKTNAFGVPYDYGSIMHYSSYAFSSNGQPTILSKQTTSIMGQRKGFSTSDLRKINAMYKCSRQHKNVLDSKIDD